MGRRRENHATGCAVEKLSPSLLEAVRHRASKIYGSRGASISIQQVCCSLLRKMTLEDIEELVAAWETADSLYGTSLYRDSLDKALSGAVSIVASDYSDIDKIGLPDAQH